MLILSPIAVGFGVNIQAANHVIHYTRHFNPAKEDQATDRSYRIGQERPVFVYCPIVYAEDFTTFDIKLDQLLTSKRRLADDMLNGSGSIEPDEFNIVELVPPGEHGGFGEYLTLDDAIRMDWDYLEALTAALKVRAGFKRVYLTPKTDDGVDVVAISENHGELIQCKSSGTDDEMLGWDAVKDVVTGEASYRLRHPGVSFQKSCITNQYFNDTAQTHATLNNVILVGQSELGQLLISHPISMLDVERFLYTNWEEKSC